MPSKHKTIFAATIGLLLGLPVAFFVVVNAIFSDAFALNEHLTLWLMTLVAYGGLGYAMARLDPQRWWRWVKLLSIPVIILVALFSLGDLGSRLTLHAFYLLLAIDGALVGGWLGRRGHIRDLGPITPEVQANVKTAAGILAAATVLAAVGTLMLDFN